jgi:hypothetical protein
LRPNTTAYAWFGFYGLKASQEVRAGDTYAIDYVLHGFASMASFYRKLAIVVQCNGTDFHWDGNLLKASVIGYHNTFLVDLPLGSHRLKAGLYVAGFKDQAIWTPEYTITVRRVRYSSAELAAGTEGKLPSDWNDAPAGHCTMSALCRILKDWQVAAEAAGLKNYFLTSYTLLGHRLWGWFMPWRGDHRWDRGATLKLLSILTPKTCAFYTIFLSPYHTPAPYTLHATPNTLRPKSQTIQPYDLDTCLYTLNPTHSTPGVVL